MEKLLNLVDRRKKLYFSIIKNGAFLPITVCPYLANNQVFGYHRMCFPLNTVIARSASLKMLLTL